ncbi:MAG: hypothetical protein AABX24_00785 [Nanoarchaeota archaeon]
MSDQDKILYFLKVVGPTIPSKVAKNIGTEILLASAHLSDLAAQGKVKISNLKIGGTPLYYLPGQEEQLYHFAAGNLNPKDFQVLEILKQQKILRENSLDLLSKVALRSLKDFTVPLQVTVAGNRELFWKWHMLSDEEASSSIKQILFVREEAREEIVAPAANEEVQSTLPSLPQPLQQSPQSVQESEQISALSFAPEEPFEPLPEPLEDELQEKIEKVLSQNKSKSTKTKRVSRKPKIYDSIPDNFLPSAEFFLAAKEIVIQEHEIVRKNAEVNLLIKVPSAVGAVTYFCKAKKKAKCDEGDVSAAYMEAQIKKLPLLFLYTHELTKKAQEMLGTEAFQNAVVAKLERGV